MDPYSSPYIIHNKNTHNPFPQSLLSTREQMTFWVYRDPIYNWAGLWVIFFSISLDTNIFSRGSKGQPRVYDKAKDGKPGVCTLK